MSLPTSRPTNLAFIRDVTALLVKNDMPTLPPDDLHCENSTTPAMNGDASTIFDCELSNLKGGARKKVAIKVIHSQITNGGDITELRRPIWRLCREAVWLKYAKHNNIVAFIGVSPPGLFQEAPGPGVVTEWCEKGNMRDFLKSVKLQLKSRRLSFVADVARGLGYLHGKLKIAHCNLNTTNILVTQDRAVICGFGQVRRLDASLATVEGLEFKTEYSAPEFIAAVTGCEGAVLPTARRGELQDWFWAKADVWSFAMCALEISSGKEPYYNVRPYRRHAWVMGGETPERAKYHQTAQITGLWELLTTCWTAAPADRPRMQYLCDRIAEMKAEPGESD